MLFILLALTCQDFSNVDWQASATHFESADITTESRRQLKKDLEETFADIRGFRAHTSIGKNGVIVTKELRLSSIKKHDVIKSLNGRPVNNVADLKAVLSTIEPGEFIKADLIRPTPKGNRANYEELTVDYSPTSEYLLALTAFEAVKLNKQTVYVPVESGANRAIFYQLTVSPDNKFTQQIVFNYRRHYRQDPLDGIVLSAGSGVIKFTGLEGPGSKLKKNTKTLPGGTVRDWIEVGVTGLPELDLMINGGGEIILKFSTETEIQFEKDVSDSLKESKIAVERLKAALKSKQ